MKKSSFNKGVVFTAFIALVFFGNSAYIHLKAEFSQVLIYKSWENLLKDGNTTDAKPWSWADTYPVAKISFKKNNIEMYVLSSTSGEALSFGPGHYINTPLPAENGDSVIAGHRDTHFEFLKDVEIGDVFEVQNYKRTKANYEIKEIKIIDSTNKSIKLDNTQNRLQLITCYPFDAVNSGGPLRYVVFADRVDF